MKRLWHFVDATTGVGAGCSVFDTAEGVQRNLPAGMAVWAAESFDHLSERVDFESSQTVPYQPPAPAESDMETWRWDEDARRWLPVPTRLALAMRARAERDRRLAESDWVTLRAVRTGQAIPADWAAYMQSLADVPAQPGFPESITWPTPPSP